MTGYRAVDLTADLTADLADNLTSELTGEVTVARRMQHRLIMETPLEITCRGMSSSPAIEVTIRSWMKRLEHTTDRIERCHVIIELPHGHERQGNTFSVHLELTVPARTVVVSRPPPVDTEHEDLYVALADAFRAARRQLQDHAQIRRGDGKHSAAG
ncbi:MAG: HPF/RaiA family ribosome-associated protein [Myxococcota bacterium]|nr:HPF/RaiA family ribosome-associated protein [Myxococcota bacterium]